MLKFNGNTPKKIFYNEKKVSKLIFNNIVVWIAKVLTTITGKSPLTLENSTGEELVDYKIYGESVQGILPDGYTQLEYIESTGTQYIDTGYKANINTTKFIGSFLLKEINKNRGVLGSRNQIMATNASCNVFIFENNFRFDWTSGDINQRAGITSNTKYEIEITAGYRKVNGVETRISYTSGFPIQYNNFYIGNFSNGSSTPFELGLNGYIYECSLYDNDILVRNLIPAKRNSDGVIGMYDLVTNTFFTNAGSGSFLAGNTTPTPETPIEIESVGNLVTEGEQGGYKIPVTVSGKNLFDGNLGGPFYHYTSGAIAGYSVKYKGTLQKFFVKAGKFVTLSFKTNLYNPWCTLIEFNLDGTYKKNYSTYGKKIIINFEEDCLVSFSLWCSDDNEPEDWEDVQVEISGKATPYEPYFEPRTENIYLNEPLRKIGDYADYIDFERKKVVRHIKELDGENLQWALQTSQNRWNVAIEGIFDEGAVRTDLGFAEQYPFTTQASSKKIGMFRYSKQIYCYNNSLTETPKGKVQFILAEPVEEDIMLPEIITTKGTNIISTDTKVEPSNIEVKYYKNL